MPTRTMGVVAVVVVLLAAGGGFAAGYLLKPAASSTPGSTSNPSGTISITAAGTLGTLFPAVANQLANESPGITVTLAAQQYQGSLAALAAITQLHGTFDVAAAADFRLIPSQLEPTYASREYVFATTPEVLAYDATNPALSGVNSTNWPTLISASGFRLAIANASTDPNGYNEIFVLQLQGALTLGSLGALYGHFFTTAVGALAEPNPTTTVVEPETQAATLISTHQVAAFIIYRSYAASHHLAFVDFDPRVGLGNITLGANGAYGGAMTTILTANGTKLLHGAPVAFAVTVPSNAPSNAIGTMFVHLLLSAEGSRLLTQSGFVAVTPAWVDRPSGQSAWIAPETVTLPASLASLLSS
ncbi:MAG: substrate-binding domain-containing protein [Thermoplasmata archaeon]|nr:substrate-binding domain-containing protein [Thermoplasmata archaeon]